ncbi:hypothetical protein VTO42DRAFT_7202 [Malbranchea cinnamomea]
MDTLSRFCAQHAPSRLSDYCAYATVNAKDVLDAISQHVSNGGSDSGTGLEPDANNAPIQLAPTPSVYSADATTVSASGVQQFYLLSASGSRVTLTLTPEVLQLGLVVILAAIVVVYVLNVIFNTLSLNNFTWDRYDWSKEIVLVTGGSSGIGELTVQKFAKRKVKVVALDINPPPTPFVTENGSNGAAKENAVANGSGNVWFYRCDITNPDALRDTAAQIYRDVGHPTVLINNAGIISLKTILDTTPQDVHRTLNVNTISHFWTVQQFLPEMIRKNHGHIVTVASMASYVTIAGNVDYSCSKAAALAFHEGLVQELKHRYNARRIRATSIHPFWARTNLTSALQKRKGFASTTTLNPEIIADAIVKQVLSGRSGQIVIPRYMTVARGLRGWPHWMQDLVRGSQAGSMVP